MGKIKIVCDSSVDLPEDLLADHDIMQIPFPVTFGDQTYADGVDITRDEFYVKMAESKDLPKTSQIPPQTYVEAFNKAMALGDEIIYLGLSSGLSGTVQSAALAAHMTGHPDRITIVDTKAASVGHGLLTLEAAELAAAGKEKAGILSRINDLISRLNSLFTLDNLDNLLRGGRINRVQAVLGTFLDIKPILHLNEDGKIDQFDKVRGRKKSLRQLLDLMGERGKDLAGQRVGISHAHCLADAEWVKQEMLDRFSVKEVVIGEIGATIGTHTGPGCLAIFFFSEPIR